MSLILYSIPLNKTIPQVSNNIIVVLIAVAKLESMPLIPIFAKIAVREANNADNIA